LLLVIWIGFCAVTELSAEYLFSGISRVRGRIEEEQKAAFGLRANAAHPAVLFIGNSLFERGIDIPLMRGELPVYNVTRFVVSDTSYLDWYYGLRRIFNEGARPQTVVIGLSASQLLAHRIEGDLSANVLIRTADVSEVGHDLLLNNTALSNLYCANLSAFYGSSTQFRKWLLGKMLPDIDSLGKALRPASRPLPEESAVAVEAARRLKAMNELCLRNGAKLIFVIPPTIESSSDSAVETIEKSGKGAGVVVLVPVRPGKMPPEFFSDGFHLNEPGAVRFTALLAAELKHSVSDELDAKKF
jgi:hypothetical protein